MTTATKHKEHKKPSVIGRYKKVLSVLVKYGFEDSAASPSWGRLVPKIKKWLPVRNGRPALSFTTYERIRMVCEELGTTFIKFAQIASNRPDILPDELIAELANFQDNVPKVPKEEILKVLEREMPKPLKFLFEHIDFEPIASASMAQVHRATLIGGWDVVLKIQRPGIEETIEQDIAILQKLGQILEKNFPSFASYQPVQLVKMFERSIRKELNFSIEASNMIRFQKQFENNPDIYVPTAYPEFSTDKVLCMEYIDGVKITDLEALAKIGMSGKELALKGISLYFEQVFDHGFFHADPHPGNIFVMPDKRVCFIDYGMMGQVIDSDKRLLASMLLAVHERDVEGLKRSLMRFSWNETKINEKELEYDIIEFFSNYTDTSIDQIDGTEVLAALNSLFFDYKIKVPPNLLLLLKALVIIEGVGLMLDPKYDIIENIAPFVKRLLEKKYSPKELSKNLIKAMGDFSNFATNLPEELDILVHKIRKGKLHIEFEHKGLENLIGELEEVSKRISLTIVLTAIILGSSLIIIADIPPKIKGIPLLAFVGFILAGFLGLFWMRSVMKKDKY
jgi:ubiquinone biosynthesis protein